MGAFPVFGVGVGAFVQLLKIDVDRIMAMIDNEGTRVKEEVQRVEKLKTQTIESQIEKFLASLKFVEVGKHEAFAKQQRANAIQTMRRLPMLGYTYSGAYLPDFEWPTADELKAMPLDKTIQMAALSFHTSDNDTSGNYIGAI